MMGFSELDMFQRSRQDQRISLTNILGECGKADTASKGSLEGSQAICHMLYEYPARRERKTHATVQKAFAGKAFAGKCPSSGKRPSIEKTLLRPVYVVHLIGSSLLGNNMFPVFDAGFQDAGAHACGSRDILC